MDIASNDIEAAFLNAGIVSEKDLKTKRRKEQKEKRDVVVKHMQERRERNKERQEIEKGIQLFYEGWNDSETHHILVELLKGFTPFAIASFAWEDEQLGLSKRCCVCDIQVVSKEHLLRKSGMIAEHSIEFMRKEVSGEFSSPQHRAQEFRKGVQKALGGDMKGAVVSPNTQLMLCPICFRHFQNWVMTALMTGDIDSEKLMQEQLQRTNDRRK